MLSTASRCKAEVCEHCHAELITLASRLIALVQACDAVAADQEALALASDKFQDLLKVSCFRHLAYIIQQLFTQLLFSGSLC